MDMQAEARAPSPVAAARLVYDGRLADLYRIFWRNVLLTVLTLGWFRFWAVTRNRRYLWAHTSFLGSRFEYTGTGGEKLRGFLVAAAMVGVLWGVNQGVALSGLPKDSPLRLGSALTYLAVLLLLGQVAPFSAQRYRLSRTLWRGLGGGMRGSALGYGARAILFSLANALTLFLLTPLRRMRLVERRVAASRFGDVPLGFVRERGLGYAAFLGAWALRAGLVFGWTALLAVFTFKYLSVASPRHAASLPPSRLVLWFSLAGILLFPALNRIGSSWYEAAVLRRVLARLRYLDLRFSTRLTGRDLFVLRVKNFGIVLVTLGLGAPIVRQRCARFVADHIEVSGAFEPERLQRESTPLPDQGEGLFEAFDVGFLY